MLSCVPGHEPSARSHSTSVAAFLIAFYFHALKIGTAAFTGIPLSTLTGPPIFPCTVQAASSRSEDYAARPSDYVSSTRTRSIFCSIPAVDRTQSLRATGEGQQLHSVRWIIFLPGLEDELVLKTGLSYCFAAPDGCYVLTTGNRSSLCLASLIDNWLVLRADESEEYWQLHETDLALQNP